jgi:signal transduction histidine kinase
VIIASAPPAVRRGVVVVAVGVGALAVASDPGSARDDALVGLAVLVLGAWAVRPRLPTPVLAVGVVVPVVAAVRSGQVEPALFLVSMLATGVAWFERSTAWAVAVGVAAAAAPLVTRVLMPASEAFGYWNWTLGIVFSWVLGRLVHRQLDLLARLEAAQRELAGRVVFEERQRIARDVHDLVGHGLATVLLQITSARHVLRRSTDAADEALAAAETAGRASMAELRRTMSLLRNSDDATPAPGLNGIADLVQLARERGLAVRHTITGDPSDIDDGQALAVHRIVQESLTNARRHAPEARTAVTVSIGSDTIAFEVTSTGPLVPRADDGRPRYGLVGMRERAELAGGELTAAPAPEGWCVRGRLPTRRSA